MYKHILVATDGSDLAGKAVSTGFALAKALNSKITAVTVTEPWAAIVTGKAAVGFPLKDYEQAAAANAERILTAVSDLAKKSQVDCTAMHV